MDHNYVGAPPEEIHTSNEGNTNNPEAVEEIPDLEVDEIASVRFFGEHDDNFFQTDTVDFFSSSPHGSDYHNSIIHKSDASPLVGPQSIDTTQGPLEVVATSTMSNSSTEGRTFVNPRYTDFQYPGAPRMPSSAFIDQCLPSDLFSDSLADFPAATGTVNSVSHSPQEGKMFVNPRSPDVQYAGASLTLPSAVIEQSLPSELFSSSLADFLVAEALDDTVIHSSQEGRMFVNQRSSDMQYPGASSTPLSAVLKQPFPLDLVSASIADFPIATTSDEPSSAQEFLTPRLEQKDFLLTDTGRTGPLGLQNSDHITRIQLRNSYHPAVGLISGHSQYLIQLPFGALYSANVHPESKPSQENPDSFFLQTNEASTVTPPEVSNAGRPTNITHRMTLNEQVSSPADSVDSTGSQAGSVDVPPPRQQGGDTSFRVYGHFEYENGMYLCPYCDERMSFERHMRKHVKTHNSGKQFKCSFCTCAFDSKSKRKYHVYIVHPNRPCAQERITTEMEDVVHRCELCKQKFDTENHLRLHMLAHRSDHPHKCSMCPCTFRTKAQLTIHKRDAHWCNTVAYSALNFNSLRNPF